MPVATAPRGPDIACPHIQTRPRFQLDLYRQLDRYLRPDRHPLPVIGLPIVNHDNNQHAANENLRLRNLWDGIDTYAAMLAELRW